MCRFRFRGADLENDTYVFLRLEDAGIEDAILTVEAEVLLALIIRLKLSQPSALECDNLVHLHFVHGKSGPFRSRLLAVS